MVAHKSLARRLLLCGSRTREGEEKKRRQERDSPKKEEIMQEGEGSRNKSAARDADNAGEHGKDHVVLNLDYELMVLMEEKLASTRGKRSYRSTIFRVPEDIRNDDAAAYSPKVVSIGLLQQNQKQRLDEHKWHYLDKFLSRSTNNLEMYIKEMVKVVHEAVSCYSGCPEPDYRAPEGSPAGTRELWLERYYALNMLVDGCFIIDLLLQLEVGEVEINDPIYSDRWTLPRVGHDMLLLENQLPFFVLEKLWELTGRERPTLKTKVLQFFCNLLPEEHDLELPETEDVHHLLHLIHLSLQPASSSKKPESTSGTRIPGPPQPGDTLSSTKNYSSESTDSFQPTSPAMTSQPVNGDRRRYKRSNLMPYDRTDPSDLNQTPPGLQIPRGQQIKQMSEPRPPPPPPPKTVPSATELLEAGVKFHSKKARSFLDVTFEQGLMQMPRLTISDSTNSLFRNFIAFEQGFPDCGSHFTSYCIFMDSLINTPRDVEILKQSGIIEHVLGSDEEVALLFNKLSRGITWDFKNSYLAKVFEDVNQHTQKRWPKWRAKLVRDYFSNPWAILSLIAAIVILILTFLQTYFAVFAYFRPP